MPIICGDIRSRDNAPCRETFVSASLTVFKYISSEHGIWLNTSTSWIVNTLYKCQACPLRLREEGWAWVRNWWTILSCWASSLICTLKSVPKIHREHALAREWGLLWWARRWWWKGGQFVCGCWLSRGVSQVWSGWKIRSCNFVRINVALDAVNGSSLKSTEEHFEGF